MSTSRAGNSSGSNGLSENGTSGEKKRFREESRSVGLEKHLRKSKVDRVTVKFDPITGGCVGLEGTYFSNAIPQTVCDTFPPHITLYKDVPKSAKELVFARLDLKFIYPHDNNIVMGWIEGKIMKAFREWRHHMKSYWKAKGGKQNNEVAKRNPYTRVDLDEWKVLCDFFSTKEQETISAQNQQNRQQRVLEGGQGSKSIVSHVYEALSTTDEAPSVIDTFEKLHCKDKESNTWRNEYAAEKHGVMVQLRDSQATTGVKSSASIDSGEEGGPKHLDIMREVLGSRSRHLRGYGTLPRLKTIGGSRASASTSNNQEKDKLIAELQQKVATQSDELASYREELARQREQLTNQSQLFGQLQHLVPGFRYDQPTISSCQSTSHRE